MPKLIRTVLLALALTPFATALAAAEKDAGRASLLFFMNPNGQPCQIQAQILESIRGKLEKEVSLIPVSTTQAADRAVFQKFGIRYLPALVVVDANQREIKRFSPGIQAAEAILKETLGALGQSTR